MLMKNISTIVDNGKASLLGVETQRNYLSQGMRQDEKIEKWNQEEKACY